MVSDAREFTVFTVWNQATLTEEQRAFFLEALGSDWFSVIQQPGLLAPNLWQTDSRKRQPLHGLSAALAEMPLSVQLRLLEKNGDVIRGIFQNLAVLAREAVRSAKAGDRSALAATDIERIKDYLFESMARLGEAMVERSGGTKTIPNDQLPLAVMRALLIPREPTVGSGRPPTANSPAGLERVRAAYRQKAEALLNGQSAWRNRPGTQTLKTVKRASKEAFEAAFFARYRRLPTMDKNDSHQRSEIRKVIGLAYPWFTCIDVLEPRGGLPL